MAVEEETIVPEAGFLRYRYLTVAGWTTVGVLSMVWVLPFAQGAALAPVWMIFVAWTLFIVATASAVVAWLPLHVRSLRYCFEGDRLVAHSGVWYHSKVFIPYARITDINVQQGPLERRFGIHRVFVQTAGSYLPEAILFGIGNPDRVRERLLRGTPLVGDGATEGSPSEVSRGPLRGVRGELASPLDARASR